MFLRTITVIFLIGIIISNISFAQGEAAVPFLLISPYAQSNGMGETSVAVTTGDPLAMITNPAHLGMQIGNGRFAFGYNHSDWFAGINIKDLYYRTYAVNGGIRLNDLFDIAPVLTLGAGYSRVHINLGKHTITDAAGPEPRGAYKSYETSDQFTISAGFDYLIKASVGVSFKQIYSKLGPFGTEQEAVGGEARVNSYDYGVLVSIPVIGEKTLFNDEPFRIGESLLPYFDLNFGMAMNNLGDKKIAYIDGDLGDPLPRYARIGIGLNVGFHFEREETAVHPLSIKWTREANDILVQRYSLISGYYEEPGWKYRSGLGDINFFNEVILGETNPESIMKTGWEIGILEFLYIRRGRFEDAVHRGNRNFSTNGYTVRFAGIANLLRSNTTPKSNNSVFVFILNHFDIQYNQSNLNTDEAHHPLDKTRFKSVNVILQL